MQPSFISISVSRRLPFLNYAPDSHGAFISAPLVRERDICVAAISCYRSKPMPDIGSSVREAEREP